jgi:dTDP-4-amino-4,6-dideoxygalactose transaminase
MGRLYLSPPHMGMEERALLLDAFDSNWIAPLGPHVEGFEREIEERVGQGVYAVALSSGTAGLHLALRVLGVGQGDAVVTSTFTFAATANAIMYQGAEPVFVDSEPNTWNMDAARLEEALEGCRREGRRVGAVVVVDLYGQCAAYDEILPVCARYGVPVIEDAAEALGATWGGVSAGAFGDVGVFSFNGNKIITTSGGGMLVTKAHQRAQKVRHLATQAREPAAHYQHAEIGYNYRLSNLLAAVGRGQLRVLGERVAARRRVFGWYQEALAGVEGVAWMPEDGRGECTRWLTCLTIDPGVFGVDREAVRVALGEADIEARPLWKPMHMQPVFGGMRAYGGGFAEGLFERGLCLPSGSAMVQGDVERVVEVIKRVRGR